MNERRTSRYSKFGLGFLLASLASIPIGIWDVHRTSGDFQPLAAAAFHAIWGGGLCLFGTAFSVVGVLRGPRTTVAWIAFSVAICSAAFFRGRSVPYFCSAR